MMVFGYPVLFWLAVGLASGALAVVLMGLGYLLGRRAALREAEAALAPLGVAVERLGLVVEDRCEGGV